MIYAKRLLKKIKRRIYRNAENIILGGSIGIGMIIGIFAGERLCKETNMELQKKANELTEVRYIILRQK